MDAEKRLEPRRDFGVIEEHERLDQFADIGRADEARYGPVPVTASAEYNSAHTGAYGFGCNPDVETTVGVLDYCS
jgi:hypothetical protein